MFFCKMRCDLCEQSRFSDSRIAADKHERAAYDSAAEYDVEFGYSGGGTFIFFVSYLR